MTQAQRVTSGSPVRDLNIKDQAVRDTLVPMAAGIFFFSSIHVVLSVYSGNTAQACLNVVTAGLFLLFWGILSKARFPVRYSHLVATLFGAVILSNIVYSYHVGFTDNARQATNEIYLALVLLGMGVVFLSARHFAFLLVVTGAAWVLITAAHADLDTFLRKLTHLIVVGGFSVLVFSARRRTYERMAEELQERMAAETALHRSKRQYEDLVNNQGEGMLILDADGVITFSNPAAEDIFQTPSTTLIGTVLGSLLSPAQWARFEKRTTAIAPGNPGRFELTASTPAGDRHLLVTATQMVDDDDNATGIQGLFRDITDRKLAEEKQRRLAEQIQKTQQLESLGVLAGGIAHDFNNILMGVMGNADVIIRDAGLKGDPKDCVDEIVSASKRAAELCRQMLAYSGKGKFVITRMDLSAAIRDMAHLLAIPTTEKAVITYQLSEVLPAIEADAGQIGQVIMNLVTNAAEAIDAQNGEIRVTTSEQRIDQSYTPQPFLPDPVTPGAYVALEVTDNGCGMDPETLSRLFDPFFSTKFTGRGLGLAAVLGIVRGHSGAIEVFSEPGKGSSFRILIPAVSSPPTSRCRYPVEKTDWRGRGTVLLVDDEALVLRVGARMLRQLGFDVILAEDGAAGVTLFEERRDDIALVILDQTMPRMNGETAFRRIREISPDAVVLLSSGYNEAETAADLVPDGLAGFLPKPYDTKVLRGRLKAVFEGRQAFDSIPPGEGMNTTR